MPSIPPEEPVSHELVIRSDNAQVAIAIRKDKLLTELHRERRPSGASPWATMYLARVRKGGPGLNAAFVDVGHEKDAFLHYFDLGPQYRNSYKVHQGRGERLGEGLAAGGLDAGDRHRQGRQDAPTW